MRFARTAIGAGLALALLTGPGALAADYPPPSDDQGTVTPSRIHAGECAVFSGGKFVPGSDVAVTDDKEPRGSATADGDGRFEKQLCYDADTPPGKHVLKGTGDAAGSNGRRTVTATLTIEGVSQSQAAAAQEPPRSLPRADDTEGFGGGTLGRGSLAYTGFPALASAFAGLLLVGVGSLLLVVGERRHRRRRLA